MQLYFATTGALSLGQTHLMTNPKFRELMNITPLPHLKVIEVKPKEPQGKAGVYSPPKDSYIDRSIDGVKNWFKEVRRWMEDTVRQFQGKGEEEEQDVVPQRHTKEELKEAKSYNERRKMEADYQRELANLRRRAAYREKMEGKDGR